MRRELTPDFAKTVAQTAIGQTLHAHFGVSVELPSPFRSLLERMDLQDTRGAAARYPVKATLVQNRAASSPAPVYPTAAETFNGDERSRRVAALLARAEEARAAAETMQAPGPRESMFCIAATYEKIARSMIKSIEAHKKPTSEIS